MNRTRNIFKVYAVFLLLITVGLELVRGQQYSTEHILTLDSSMLSVTIKFENTDEDTLHSVLIIDTLAKKLDKDSFELGVSSHHYDFMFLDTNVICWHIYNVRIPGIGDKTHNHGFVKYHIVNPDSTIKHVEVAKRPKIYFNYASDFTIDMENVYAFQHHEFSGVETKANVKVKMVDKHDELDIKGKQKFDNEQIYVEIFDDKGTVEFFGKLNKKDNFYLNTSFLRKGNHYLDVYDNHHHEIVKKFSKK